MIHRGAIFLFVFALIGSHAHAATYYVSQSGNDANPCETAQSATPSEQKQTIADGVACLQAGDTLYIHAGTYTGFNNVIDSQLFVVRSGSSFDNPITIAAFPGERVTLQPPDNVSGIRLTTGAPHHLIFQDLVIDLANSTPGTDAAGVFLYTAHHIRLDSMEVTHSQSFGVHFGEGSPGNEVLNSRIHDNGYADGPPTNGHGLYISSSNNVFDGNEVYDNQGYGFHVYSNWGSHTDPSNNVLRNNSIHGNGRHGAPAYGIVLAWGNNNVAHDNVIFDNTGGVQVYTDATATRVYNNTIYGNSDEGIALQYYGPGIVVQGNVTSGNRLPIEDYGGSAVPAIDGNLAY